MNITLEHDAKAFYHLFFSNILTFAVMVTNFCFTWVVEITLLYVYFKLTLVFSYLWRVFLFRTFPQLHFTYTGSYNIICNQSICNYKFLHSTKQRPSRRQAFDRNVFGKIGFSRIFFLLLCMSKFLIQTSHLLNFTKYCNTKYTSNFKKNDIG